MTMNFAGPLLPAILIVVLVLVLEEWAWFRARTRLQRALVTGAAVFVLLVIANLFWVSPGH